jgi:hypothetical protein
MQGTSNWKSTRVFAVALLGSTKREREGGETLSLSQLTEESVQGPKKTTAETLVFFIFAYTFFGNSSRIKITRW